MAQCKGSAQKFIQDAFSPSVAVLCSHDAELVCQKNNLSFVELIQPFCKINAEAHIRDPGNVSHTVHNLRINVRDMNQSPPQSTLVKKMLNEAVSNALPQNYDGHGNSVLSVGTYDLQLSTTTPWFEAYRECFLQVAYPSDHEFLKHFLACIFVVSSSHADPMDQFSKLTQQQQLQQHQQPAKLPRWFSPNVLRYYVLIHDVMEEQEAKAESVYQSMKSTYGVNNCHLLHINSRNPNTADPKGMDVASMPDPWSQYLPRRQDNNEVPSFEPALPDSSGFPSHVQEGQPTVSTLSQSESMLSLDGVDSALEATEGPEAEPPPPPQLGAVIDHPLAPDHPQGSDHPLAPDITNNYTNHDATPNSNNPDLIRESQNISVADTITMDTKGKSQSHGGCLLLSDHDRLRVFVHEFVIRGLIPWAERTLRTLNDQVMSRKGIHRSFLNIGKKWFVGNKPTNQSPATERSSVIYTPEAPEMQMRRLADLAFMFQLHELAYQTYHTCKKEFNSEHAWLHFAGSLEMACMSVFMQGPQSQRQYPNHYMESAITTYLNTCRNPQFAARATLLSTEALKSKGLYTEAALLFIKMTSEDSDLRSALLLEQAAHCFINMKHPMVRKYAFHMILAGHRFSKAGQRRHALRSYSQALQVYKGKDWTLAEDHINFTLGRQSFNLKQLENATSAFKHLLTEASRQSPPQQNAFLREYLFVFKQQLNQYSPDVSTGGVVSGELPQLPLPVIDGNATKVLVVECPKTKEGEQTIASSVDFSSNETDSATWHKLEELIMVSNHRTIPMNFQPTTYCYSNHTDNKYNPVCVHGEPVTLEVMLTNPMKVQLVLLNVSLLWKFLPVDFNADNVEKPGQLISNESANLSPKNEMSSELVDTQVIPELVLQGSETRPVRLSLTCHVTGELHVTGLAYSLGTNTPDQAAPLDTEPANISKPSFIAAITIRGKATLDVQGPRLNNTKEERSSKMYGPDRRLDLVIVPKMPKLQVIFSEFPETLLCGELRQISVEFTNTGSHALVDLQLACTHPEFFALGSADSRICSTNDKCLYETLSNTSESDSEEYLLDCPDVKFVYKVALPSGQLESGQKLHLPMWLCGPSSPGQHPVHFLFYYKSKHANPRLKYRVLHHKAQLTVHASLALRACAVRAQDTTGQSDSSKDDNPRSVAVSLEVENMNNVQDCSITEFSILQVSCVSCRWHLCHLSTQRHSDIRISSMESTLMCFRATRCKRCVDPCSRQKVFTNVTFDQHQIDSAVAPCAVFYSRSQSQLCFKDWKREPPQGALGLDHSESVEEPSPHADLDQALHLDLTLIVLWKAFVVDESGTCQAIQGQHHITLTELNKPVSAPPPNKMSLEQGLTKIIRETSEPSIPSPRAVVTTQLVKYQLHYSKHVLHDYTAKRLCHVPVRLSLHNCSATSVDVHIDKHTHIARTPAAEEDSQSEPSALVPPSSPSQSQSNFSWSGRANTVISLEPDATHSQTLHAVFNQPGVYDLGDLAISVKVTGSLVRQKVQGSQLLVIRGSSSSKKDSKIT